MSLLSLQFLIFIGVLLLFYYLLPCRWQRIVLLCANLYFYFSAGISSTMFLVMTAVISYQGAGRLEKINEDYRQLRKNCLTREEKQVNKAECIEKKKRTLTVILVLNLGMWILLKYMIGMAPLGISFYTFIACGYCIDVYRGKFGSEKKFSDYFLFLSFFPQMVQGPFSRYDWMKEQLISEHRFSFEQVSAGAKRFIWGFFKKLIVADRLSIVSGMIYAGGREYGGIYVPVLMMIVTFQLYADFSGYMDIVCGISKMLGINLQENFRQPFYSKSIEEVWRRWHITLGAWFRDYVFYPVSMSKKVQEFSKKCRKKVSISTARMLPSYIALAAVWTATGLWHGLTGGYLLWGWMNLFAIGTSMVLQPVYGKIREKLHINLESRGYILFQRIRTFFIFGFMEMVSDAGTIKLAGEICLSLFKANWGLVRYPMQLLPGLDIVDFVLVMIGIIAMLWMDAVRENNHDVRKYLCRFPLIIRSLGYAVLIYLVIIFGNTGSNLTGGFMYAQF